MTQYEQFIDYVYNLSQMDTSNIKLDEQVFKCMMDYTSAIIGGTKLARRKINNLLEEAFDDGDYNVVGYKDKTSLENALLSNGFLSHVAELDDGVIDGIIHPGAAVFTAIFTVFQKKKIDWSLFVKAVTVGYEVACRIAEAIQPGHKLLGYHASATCGTLGVAMALATISNFDKGQMRETLTVALASTHGTLKVLEDKSELKPYNIASAVINGFVAFQMAKAGFKGADNPFEGEAGFFSQMAKEVNYENLLADKDELCIFKSYFKPYASCRYTHPGLEAAMNLRQQHKLDEDQIADMQISTYSIAIRHHDHTEVPNVASAKMCIPFAAAVGFLRGSGGIDAFCDETIEDLQIKNLTRKVRVVEDEKFSALFPTKSVATLSITTKDGNVYSYTVDMPKGEPDNPMTADDILNKLKQSCIFAGFSFNSIQDYVDKIKSNAIEDYFGNLNKYYSE